jgi:hypothetical protein
MLNGGDSMTKWIACGFLVSAFVFACGGGEGDGGIDDDVRIAELSDAELADECEVLVDLFPEREIDCDGTTVTIGFENVAECTGGAPDDPACTATVGQAEDCFEALGDQSDDEICSETIPPECAPLASSACN